MKHNLTASHWIPALIVIAPCVLVHAQATTDPGSSQPDLPPTPTRTQRVAASAADAVPTSAEPASTTAPPKPWDGWTPVNAPAADAPTVTISPDAFTKASQPASVNMHFARDGWRPAQNGHPGQPWWYAQEGPISGPSDNVYSYFSYVPPISPNTATGRDPKFWAQNGGNAVGTFHPYAWNGTGAVAGFD
ncbi:MAG: hypothetical protein O2800_05535 [Planctomycetota bacterium]|nr:hypothetical protein [Planctomycetota bacterium]